MVDDLGSTDARLRFAIENRRLVEVCYTRTLLELTKLETLTVLDERFKGSRGRSYNEHYKWDVVHARVE